MKVATVANGVSRNHVVRIALGAACIVMVPLVAMQFSDEVNWRLSDFVVAGTLLFAAGIILSLIINKLPNKKRKFIAAGVLAAAFLYIWAELAVGIFTHWGN